MNILYVNKKCDKYLFYTILLLQLSNEPHYFSINFVNINNINSNSKQNSVLPIKEWAYKQWMCTTDNIFIHVSIIMKK